MIKSAPQSHLKLLFCRLVKQLAPAAGGLLLLASFSAAAGQNALQFTARNNSQTKQLENQQQPQARATDANLTALVVTNLGNFELELNPKLAPTTVNNFIGYAKAGFYKNTIFHRVIDNFMIQGGGFDANLLSKTTRQPIINEADNGLKNNSYSVAMARSSHPHSANSQFFINLKDNPHLNFSAKSGQRWGYTVFGQVINGIEVIQKIAKTPTYRLGQHHNLPRQAVVIKDIIIQSPAANKAATPQLTEQKNAKHNS